MEPFVTSKIISFVYTRLKLDQVADPEKSYDKELKKLFEKGENHVNSDHVRTFSREERNKISGLVDPSYGNVKIKQPVSNLKSYSVWVTFENKEGQSECFCTCPVGNFICSHTLALMLFAQKMLSRTDFEAVWSRPKSATTTSNEIIRNIWTNTVQPAFSTPITKDDLDKLKLLADKKKQFGLFWLLEEETMNLDTKFVPVDSWVKEQDFVASQDKKTWLLNKFEVNPSEIEYIATATKKQRENVLWLRLRKFRITASMFGLVLKNVVKAATTFKYAFTQSFFKTLMGEYKLDKVKAIGYGIDHERDGITFYEQTRHIKIQPIGLVLMPIGYLGASPDGLIDQDGVIEVKCPYSARDKTLEEYLATKTCFLVKDFSGQIGLKENHDYYHQIQGTLYATGRNYCDLVCWTPNWSIVIRIEKCEDWTDNLLLIKIFYKEVFLDLVLEKLQ